MEAPCREHPIPVSRSPSSRRERESLDLVLSEGTSYRWMAYSSKVVTYWEYVLVNPAMTTWTLLSNSAFPLLVSAAFTASRRRLPAIVVNSALKDHIRADPE